MYHIAWSDAELRGHGFEQTDNILQPVVLRPEHLIGVHQNGTVRGTGRQGICL
jgi:hypothetical protein